MVEIWCRAAIRSNDLLGKSAMRAFQLTLADKCAKIGVDVVFWRGADMELTFET
jgi:hypothetical protein